MSGEIHKMKKIVECSSIYAIDYAAVIFSMLDDPDSDYELFLNEMADIKSEFRQYISRLALPTLKCNIDPNGNLRQVHMPIENILPLDFVKYVREAYYSFGNTDIDPLQADVLNILEFEIGGGKLKSIFECYKRLIELIIESVGGVKDQIHLCGKIRNGDETDICKSFLQKILLDINELNDGRYKFVKGGRIEFKKKERWISVKQFTKKENSILFESLDGCLYDFPTINASSSVRYRGPLETVLMSCYGQLIDLPWYLGGDFLLVEKGNYGIEYISPISTSSIKRTSKKIKGEGMRLVPCGYSLIEYNSENIIRVLKNIYDDKNDITEKDLESWKIIINNYPVTNQKLAKSQTSVHELCNMILNDRFKKFHTIDEGKIDHKNFVKLGDELANICILLKVLRVLNTKKSPFYKCPKWNNNYYISESGFMLKTLILDICNILDKQIEFLDTFSYKKNDVLECKELLIEQKDSISDKEFFSPKYERFFSKLEKNLRQCLYIYYEVVAFIIGVLLKANIFSAFCVLGQEYEKCVREILNVRKYKKLYFKPIYIEEDYND